MCLWLQQDVSDLLSKSSGSPPHLMRLLGSRLDDEMDMLEDFAQSIAMVYYNLQSVTLPLAAARM